MISFLTTGLILGLSAGVAPGPLLALVISETLQHDIWSGIKVALAPVITDTPIIFMALLLSASLTEFKVMLGIISFAGGLFILYLGISIMRSSGAEIEINNTPSNSFRKGILVNALSPHPYLFWFTVGAPLMTKALTRNMYCAIAFIAGFYGLLVGTKITLAIFTEKSRLFLTGRTYHLIMRMMGILLCVFAGFLFNDSMRYIGIL